MYGLQTIWLPKTMRQKINGFYCSCLRQILGIAHSYISRISNLEVLKRAEDIALDKQLLRYQLLFYGKMMRNIDHPIHDFFKKQPTQRRRGRPHLSYMRELSKHEQNMRCDSTIIDSPSEWRKAVYLYCVWVLVVLRCSGQVLSVSVFSGLVCCCAGLRRCGGLLGHSCRFII